MLSCSGQGESKGKKRDPSLRSKRKKDGRTTRGVQEPIGRNERTDNSGAGWTMKNCDSPGKPPPVRKERVEEATRKKQNGDYDSQEVYQKIADRLMDLFGI
ncbi:MAG: hypothetical protein KAV87_09390 [Desulfobacteraceae bacterium]|nr:hypothetical protein [Desulfobacteraceae bacterium]